VYFVCRPVHKTLKDDLSSGIERVGLRPHISSLFETDLIYWESVEAKREEPVMTHWNYKRPWGPSLLLLQGPAIPPAHKRLTHI